MILFTLKQNLRPRENNNCTRVSCSSNSQDVAYYKPSAVTHHIYQRQGSTFYYFFKI